MKTSTLLLSRLILVGHRKNYIVPFQPGLNIIYGDSATGKSSILECINYLLGASKFVFDTEIETSVSYAALELELGGKPYLIKRDIFQPTRHVEVYSAWFDDHASVFPKRYVPSYGQPVSGDGYFMDFLLASLGLPIVKIRTAPTREDSTVARLSFRDLFKFSYLRQDDVGSKNLLNVGLPVLHTKTKQTFRYIFNLLDENIALLEEHLSELKAKHRRLTTKYEDVSEFLRQSDFKAAVSLEDELDELESQIKILENQLSEVNLRVVADSHAARYLRELLAEQKDCLALLQSDRLNSERQIDRFVRLRNDYAEDIDRISAVVKAKSLLGQASPADGVCPVCDSPLRLDQWRESFQINSEDKLAQEASTLERRTKELGHLLTEERSRYQELSVRIGSVNDEYERTSRLLDEEVSTTVSPYLAERDGISSEIATLKERRSQVEHSAKVRRLQKSISDEIDQLLRTIDQTNGKLEKMRDAAPSLHEVLSLLGDELNDYLRVVNIKDRRGVAVSESSLLPVLREREYRDVTSGGLRTILSIGYYLSVLKAAVLDKANLPAFIMIDTVGKYLGKTNASVDETDPVADLTEGVTDPMKYQHMYDYMVSLSSFAEEKQSDAQIIVVDNDIPSTIRDKFAGFVVAQFSSTGEGGLPVGLIDDARAASLPQEL